MTKTQFKQQRRRRKARERAETHAIKTDYRRQRNARGECSAEKNRLMAATYRALTTYIEQERSDCLRSAWIANKSRMIRDKVMRADMDNDADNKDPAALENVPHTPT